MRATVSNEASVRLILGVDGCWEGCRSGRFLPITGRTMKMACRSRCLLTMLAVGVGLFVPASGSTSAATCAGKHATIVGTAGNDHIVGKGASDVIYGGGGDDTITGGHNGNDTICGGPGDDTIAGGKG